MNTECEIALIIVCVIMVGMLFTMLMLGRSIKTVDDVAKELRKAKIDELQKKQNLIDRMKELKDKKRPLSIPKGRSRSGSPNP